MYTKLDTKKGSVVRTIKAKDIRRGMVIEWCSEGLTKKALVNGVSLSPESGEVNIEVVEGYVHSLDYLWGVVVVDESKIIQPPEPTALGARVMVNDMKLVRLTNNKFPWYCLDDTSFGITWDGLCGMGQIIIVEADPWWPSEESDSGWSNVPQHIEGQWPKNDEQLREYKWFDSENNVWFYDNDVMSWMINYNGKARYTTSNIPTNGPWDMVKE